MLEPTTKNRKTVITLALIGGLVALALAGGAFISFVTISDDPANFTVHTDGVNFDSDTSLNKPTQSFTLEAENTSDNPAHFAFSFDQASLAGIDLDNPIFEEANAYVSMRTSDGVISELSPYFSLKTVLSSAWSSLAVLKPGEVATVTILVVPATSASWSSEEASVVFSHTFGALFVFNQVDIDGSSPLGAHAVTGEMFPGGSRSIAQPYFFPAADLGTITH